MRLGGVRLEAWSFDDMQERDARERENRCKGGRFQLGISGVMLNLPQHGVRYALRQHMTFSRDRPNQANTITTTAALPLE